MNKLWYYTYNFIVFNSLFVFFRFAALFNAKIRRGLRDRKKLFENLIIDITGLDRTKNMIWFHSSSMGEFEQAKPIIEKLKEEKHVNILVTFFSPSGYENSRNYPHADVISYLPYDTPLRVKRFVNIVKPNLVVLMRYDIWPNLVWHLKNKNIPCFIVDATMRKSSKRKLPVIKNFHKGIYKCFTQILTVSQKDVDNFMEFDVNPASIKAVGDTRFDRVYQKSLEAKERKLFVDGFFNNRKVFVFGSSWESDEEVILPAFLKMLKYEPNAVMILVPHEPTVMRLERLEHHFAGREKTIRFSYLHNYNNERIILIDSIGILLTLYFYADIAYVGGSFKQGIHNVLEPAVYGIPVMYGPKIDNSHEAKYMAEGNGGMVIRNKKEAYRQLRILLANDAHRKNVGEKAGKYVTENIGATEKILYEIYSILRSIQ